MKKLYGSRTSFSFLIVAGACICFALITLTGFLIGVAYKLNPTQNEYLNQSTNGQTCSSNIGCRVDLGLSCQSGVCKCYSTYQYWSTSSYKCFNYQTYTGACTSSGQECDARLKLLCNVGTTCDCPSTSSVNKCDCVREFGNESYWNGASCTAALTYGTSCQSASTSYMCQTLTQGTVCNITGTSYYCQCPSLQYFNTAQSKCLPQETNLGVCSVNIGCRIDLGLSCISTVCKCNSTYQFWSTVSFKCINYKTYTESCNPDQCDPRASLICNTGTACNCPTYLTSNKCDCTRVNGNETYWNGSTCVPAGSFGQSCIANFNYTCQTITQKTMCNSTGYCYCGTNGGLKSSTQQCISCGIGWQYVNEMCYRIETSAGPSNSNGTGSPIDTACNVNVPSGGTSSLRLAFLNNAVALDYFKSISVAGQQYWVNFHKSNCNLVGTCYTSCLSGCGGGASIWWTVWWNGAGIYNLFCNTPNGYSCGYYDYDGDCYGDYNCSTSLPYYCEHKAV